MYYRRNCGLPLETFDLIKHETFFEVDDVLLNEVYNNYLYLIRNSVPQEKMEGARIYMTQETALPNSTVNFIMLGLRPDKSEISQINILTGSGSGVHSGYRRINRPLGCPRACDRSIINYALLKGNVP